MIMDVHLDRLRYLDEIMPANVTPLYCDPHTIERFALSADLIIGAVLIPGAKAPILLKRELLKKMKNGSVLIDVSIDQGGCFETSRPTTHHDPVFIEEGVVHYCVTNMPGAVGRTSSQALCNATLPYVQELANVGLDAFIRIDKGHAQALNLRNHQIINSAISKVFPDLPHV